MRRTEKDLMSFEKNNFSDNNSKKTGGDTNDKHDDEIEPREYKSFLTVHPSLLSPKKSKTPKGPIGKSLVIGNLTWWTTEDEIREAALYCGVRDVISVKFSENRVNGLSKGVALIEVESDESLVTLEERLPLLFIHGAVPNLIRNPIFELNPLKNKTDVNIIENPKFDSEMCLSVPDNNFHVLGSPQTSAPPPTVESTPQKPEESESKLSERSSGSRTASRSRSRSIRSSRRLRRSRSHSASKAHIRKKRCN